MSDDPLEARRALEAYSGFSASAHVEPISRGLVHESFSVSEGSVECVFQRLNPVFRPEIHANIAAVTDHLEVKGLATLKLIPARDGALYVKLDGGVWRLMTRVPGQLFDTCPSPDHARAAGALVARFHSTVADLQHDFEPLGFPFHDTAAHFADLGKAVETQTDHRLHAEVSQLAEEIRAGLEELGEFEAAPARVIHGDLKFNNIMFEAGTARALSLIDLDTLSRMPLWVELGDAWRSWCNTAGEDSPQARFDLALFRAATEGYLSSLTLEFAPGERESLLLGLERISLELSARFATDALQEQYFGWDDRNYPTAGEHNLVRARGQLSLYAQARAARDERRRILLGQA